jgi:hypothetical protein
MKLHLIALVGTLFLVAIAPLQSKATEISSRPILFVHGFNVFGIGEDCAHDWGKMETGLTAQGFTGQKITVGYYFNDRNCDVITTPKGTILTSIETISHDLAWYMYDQFSSKGIEIDVVAHSMGGLALRYALYRTSIGDSNYPPYLKVAHAATMATPFTGYSLIAESCHIIAINVQCWEMFPLAPFIEGLKDPAALVPQGIDGTLWSGVGSNAVFIDKSDGFVNSAAATSMNIPASAKMILPWYKFVFHTGYTSNKGVIANTGANLALTQASANLARVSAPKRNLSSLTQSELANADAILSRDEISQDFTQVSEPPAKTEPYFTSGEAAGVRFSNVLTTGIFAKMGIANGDVVRGCDAESVNNPFEALNSLEDSTGPIQMHFCLVRGGETLSKDIVIQ